MTFDAMPTMKYHSDFIPTRASGRIIARQLFQEPTAQHGDKAPAEDNSRSADSEAAPSLASEPNTTSKKSKNSRWANSAPTKTEGSKQPPKQKRKQVATPAQPSRKKAKPASVTEVANGSQLFEQEEAFAGAMDHERSTEPSQPSILDESVVSIAPTPSVNESIEVAPLEEDTSSELSDPPSSPALDDMDKIRHLRFANFTLGRPTDDGYRFPGILSDEFRNSSSSSREAQSETPQAVQYDSDNIFVTPRASSITLPQLPTPPDSVEQDLNSPSPVETSRRQTRPPQRFGELVASNTIEEEDTPETPARANVDSETDFDSREDEEEESPTIKRKAVAKPPTKTTSKKVASGRITKTTSTKQAEVAGGGIKPISRPHALTTAKGAASAPRAQSGRRAELFYSNQKLKQKVFSIPAPAWVQIAPTIEQWPEKLQLSKKLMHRESLTQKPLPQGKPRVWADSRQALCETLPYFKKPQGGCYSNDGHVYGFLFDGLGHCREFVGRDVIICRAGGGMESDGTTMAQGRDQTFKESQVQAILNDIKHQNPVIVICGNRNEKAACKMPHVYNVLGWYKPVMAWSERTAGKGKRTYTTVKYRLERLNRHKPAWHSPVGGDETSQEEKEVAGQLEDQYQTCNGCKKRFPRVYLRHWTCLNAECESFWKFGGADIPFGAENMEYNPAFLLHEHGKWKNEGEEDEAEPTSLRPPLPDVGRMIGDNLAYVNTRGICCPECGRCNPRRLLKGWVCENPACDFTHFPQQEPVIPAMLHTPWDHAPTLIRNSAPTLHRNDVPAVTLKVEYKHGYKIATYRFDSLGIKGSFVHATATKAIDQTTGADAMFAALQTEDLGLERRTFGVKKGAGGKLALTDEDQSEVVSLPIADAAVPEAVDADVVKAVKSKPEFEDGDLMTAFSMNYGMPYKFVASGASRAFEEAPWPVPQCRRMLNWAQKRLLDKGEEGYEDFNEQLIFAYMQGQKIEYHDDGEEGLGPRIATLSLGCRAKMHMRMKLKHFVGCSKTGLLTDDRPVRGGIGGPEMDKKRLEKWEELEKVKGDSKTHKQMRASIPKELGLFEKRMKKADDLVTVTLSHGDIVVMDGYDIQKYLEHKVVPEGYFRFALTCRTVLENHLKDHEKPAYTVQPDAIEYEGPCFRARDGDGR